MKLCINTSDSKVIKVEIEEKGKETRSLQEENRFGSQVLLSLIVKLLASEGSLREARVARLALPAFGEASRAERALRDLTEIEVNEGPGSYTGLRVGASVAQALGFALNIPVNGSVNKTPLLRYT